MDWVEKQSADEIDKIVSELNTKMKEMIEDTEYEPSEREEGWQDTNQWKHEDKRKDKLLKGE